MVSDLVNKFKSVRKYCTYFFFYLKTFIVVRKWEQPKGPPMKEWVTRYDPPTHGNISHKQEQGANTSCPVDGP